MRFFNDLVSDYKTITRDSSTANETLGKLLINQFLRKVLTARDWTFNRGSKSYDLVEGQREYDLPYNCEKVRSVITKDYGGFPYYFPKEVMDRKAWNNLIRTTRSGNHTSHYFIEVNDIEIDPVPTSSPGTMEIYFQKITEDLSESDYNTGSPYVITASPTYVTASPAAGTAWTDNMEGRYIKFDDDGYYYQIKSVSSSSELILERAVNQEINGSDYTIAEKIPLPFGYEDIPLWWAIASYYRKKEGDLRLAAEYERMAKESFQELIRRDAKSSGNVIEKSDTERYEKDVNKYPQDLSE